MPIINGWVQLTPTGNRDWSTFRTTFPGTGWVKVFRVVCACPSPDPQFLDCDVFLTGSGRLYLYRSLTEVYELGESPYTYNDIAIIGNKLYARRIGGVIDEWTIGISTISLTTPSIYNSGQGQSLTAINGQLLYDIVGGTNNGKLGYTTPGTWTEAIITPPTTLPQQGDMMQVGDDKLLVTIYDDISSMEVWDISAFPTITLDRQFQIVDNLSNVITEVQGIFQSNDTIFITDLTGNVYSMSTSSPLFFTQEGSLSSLTKWSGAAQSEECGTVIIPEDTTISFTFRAEHSGSTPWIQFSEFILEDDAGVISTPSSINLANPPYFYQKVENPSNPNYSVSFTLGQMTQPTTLSIYETIDGGTETLVEDVPLTSNQNINKSYSPTVTTSYSLRYNFHL